MAIIHSITDKFFDSETIKHEHTTSEAARISCDGNDNGSNGDKKKYPQKLVKWQEPFRIGIYAGADDFRFWLQKRIEHNKTFLTAYDIIRKFFFSEYFLFIIVLMCYLCWALKNGKAGLCLCMTVLGFVFLCNRDVTPVILFIYCGPAVIPEEVAPSYYFDCFYAVIFPVITLIAHFCIYKTKIRRTGMLFSNVALVIVMLTGGIGCMTMEKFKKGFPYYLAFGPLVLIFDELMSWSMYANKKTDLTLYYAKILIWSGILYSMQTVTLYIRSGKPFLEVLRTKYGYMNYGWANTNNVATLQLLIFPMCFYVGTRYKWGAIPYTLLGLVQVFTLCMTSSRGAVIGAAGCLILSIIASVYFSQYKKVAAITWGIVIIIILLFVCVFLNVIEEFISSIFKFGLDDNGRNSIFDEAFEIFKNHPIFGEGIGFTGKVNFHTAIDFYWFHCTFLQILGDFGLLGLIGFVFHYFEELRLIFRRWKSSFNWFVLIAACGFEFYSMIDTGTFTIPTVFANAAAFTILTITNDSEKQYSNLIDRDNKIFLESFNVFRCKYKKIDDLDSAEMNKKVVETTD